MFFLENYINTVKTIKDAAGLSNSSCVMPFSTKVWKQTAVCEEREPLQKIIDSMPFDKQKDYSITDNTPESDI